MCCHTQRFEMSALSSEWHQTNWAMYAGLLFHPCAHAPQRLGRIPMVYRLCSLFPCDFKTRTADASGWKKKKKGGVGADPDVPLWRGVANWVAILSEFSDPSSDSFFKKARIGRSTFSLEKFNSWECFEDKWCCYFTLKCFICYLSRISAEVRCQAKCNVDLSSQVVLYRVHSHPIFFIINI